MKMCQRLNFLQWCSWKALIIICAVAGLASGMRDAPPMILKQSARTVWFHVPSGGAEAKQFMLRCDASGYPQLEYQWFKNSKPFNVDEQDDVAWYKEGISGSLVFRNPSYSDVGEYQCHAENIFGTAVSEVFDVRLGVLEHFSHKPVKEIPVEEYDSLSLTCSPPYGNPAASMLWVVRNTKQSFVIETIDKEHITIDDEGSLHFSHVTEFDGRENVLYQCHATSPVLQGETRAGDEHRLLVKPSVKSYRAPLLMWGSPERINVTAGQQLKLTCIFSGFPVPKLTWYKENSEMPLNRLRHENFGKTLVIDPVHPDDQGTYVCRAGARSSSAEDSHRMVVLITAAPHWKEGTPPESKVALEEENATLLCDAAGDPLPTITWYRNGDSLENEFMEEKPRYAMQEEGRVLSIATLNHDIDTAVFQCNASNPFGYLFANAYLHVLAHSPRFDTPIVSEIKRVIGQNAYLDCEVRAAPAPLVRWLDEGHRPLVITDRLKLHPNHTLEIQDLILNDAGVYRCNVSNKFGYNEALRRLQVFKPIFLVKPLLLPSPTDEEGKIQERVLEAYDSYELSCDFQADERLPIRYVWLHNGKMLLMPSDDGRHSLLNDNELQLTYLRGKDTGVYTCIGQTDVDDLRTEMKLIVKDVPETPNVSEITCNERRAKIRWEAPFDNYDPITSYLLEFKTGYHPEKWRLAVNETNVKRTDPFYAVMMLSPWVSYVFRVVAINSHGRSQPGTRPTNCTTPSAPPYKNPTVTRVQGTEKTNLVIYWKPLDKEDHNADGLKYLIKYRLNEPGAKQVEFYEHDSMRNHTVIREQDTFREYVVQVIACNQVDCSLAKPQDYIGYSGEDVPKETPKNVTILDIVNSTAVKLSWSKVSPESVMGHFQGYKVRIWEMVRRRRRHNLVRHKRALAQLPDILVPPDATTVLVDSLKPMRHYMVKVLAYNMKYEGPLSEPIKFEMPEGPPSEVTNLKSKAVGATSVFTSWEPPEHTNGIMTGYYILFRKHLKQGEHSDGASRWSDIIGKAFVLSKNRYHLWTEAEPLTRYYVSVAAETGGGIGAVESKIVNTFPLQEPNKPNMTLQILRYDSVQVTWLPSEKGMPGVGFYVNYTHSGNNQWTQSDWKTLPEREIVLSDLRADKEYQIVVVSRDATPNGDFDTPSDIKKLKIANALNSSLAEMRPKGENQPTEMLTSAAWFIAVMFGLALAFVSAIVICICTRSTGGKYPVKKKELERGHNLNIDEERSFLEYQYGSSDQKSPEGPS